MTKYRPISKDHDCPCTYMIPVRWGNEILEWYRCHITGNECKCYSCNVTDDQLQKYIDSRKELLK